MSDTIRCIGRQYFDFCCDTQRGRGCAETSLQALKGAEEAARHE